MIRKVFSAFFFGLFLPLLVSAKEKITISCGAVGQEISLCQTGGKAWSEQSGVDVIVVPAPSQSDDRLGHYLQLLSAKSAEVDVFVIDTTWPGIMKGFLEDLSEAFKEEARQFFNLFIENNSVEGRLVAIPWYVDVGLLYYRADLLEKYKRKVPTTWTELERTAEIIQTGERQLGRKNFWGYVFQGRAYEGLTCHGLEWISSFGGGTIVDSSGRITVNNPKSAAALSKLSSWIGRIAPPGALNYAEEESRGVFQAGHALFMRNWPYAWRLAQSEDSPVRGKVRLAPLPKGPNGRSQAAIGGWSLAISKYSKNKSLAMDLVRYLTSPDEQARRALVGGFHPSRPQLYQSEKLKQQIPYLPLLERILLHQSVARPSAVTGLKYNKVSAEFSQTVHDIIGGSTTAQSGLEKLFESLKRISRNEKW